MRYNEFMTEEEKNILTNSCVSMRLCPKDYFSSYWYIQYMIQHYHSRKQQTVKIQVHYAHNKIREVYEICITLLVCQAKHTPAVACVKGITILTLVFKA